MNFAQRKTNHSPHPGNQNAEGLAGSAGDTRLDLPRLHAADAIHTARQLEMIKQFVSDEAAAIDSAAKSMDQSAVAAARMTADCQGSVIVTGVGKAGLVGQKLVATLASTGTAAHFLHPCEAVHGDLGRVRKEDLVWAISNSGRSEEVTRIAKQLSTDASGLISFTATADNPLVETADVAVTFGSHREVDPNGLAPTASTAVMMAVGDAVAMLASNIRNFTPVDFAKYHPGGSLGKKLSTAADLMRPLPECRIAAASSTIRQAMTITGTHGRRSGAVMIVDDEHRLAGIFTDSDLARLFQLRQESSLDDPITQHMTAPCVSVEQTARYQVVMAQLTDKRISELPVVDRVGTLLGMIDITDLMTMPKDSRSSSTTPRISRDQHTASTANGPPQLTVVAPPSDDVDQGRVDHDHVDQNTADGADSV